MVKGRDRQQRHQHARRRGRPVPAQPRWPADHAARGRLGVRPAQGQPRGDRRVPDRDQHVRHHAGPVDRDAGAGDLPLGHQRPARRRPMGSSAATRLNAADPVANKVLPFENQQVGRHRWAARSSRTGCTSSASYEYERQPADGVPGADAAAAPDLRVPDEADQQELSRPGRLSTLVHGHASRSAGSVGRSTTRSRSRSGTAHPSTAEQLRQSIDQCLRHLDACRQVQPDACSCTAATTASPGTTMRFRRMTCRSTTRRSSSRSSSFPA